MKKVFVMFLVFLLALIALPVVAMAEEAAGTKVDLTPVFQAVIGLLAALITVRVIPWIKGKTTAQQQALLSAAVNVAVFAAEQIYGAGGGQEKMRYVATALAEKGFVVDIDEIEAAVRRMNVEGTVFNFDVPVTIEETHPPDEAV